MKKFFSTNPWGIVLLSFASACVLAAFIFPEFLIERKLEFVRNTFTADYWGSFTLTSFFYQGGMQLWDPYDQMPLAYYYLTLGIGKFFNVLTALTYIIFSPLSNFNAEFFEETFSAVFFLSNLFLKVAGSYLLFRKFSSSRLIVIAATVYLAVIASAFPFVTGGLSYGSYIPLLVYLTLNVFEFFRLRDILMWAVFFCVLLADHLTHTTYLYQGIHFMVLACIIWAFLRRKTLTNPFKDWRKPAPFMAVILTAAACLFLLIPIIYLLKGQMGDLDFGARSRSTLLQPFNWHAYFTRYMEFGSPQLFLSAMIDYSRNLCWTCVGYAVVFFALFGLVMSRDQRRFIFLTALAFIWMLNHPRDNFPFGFIAHALNVLTNPLSFSVRLFGEMQVYFLPVWMMGLAVMGLESFRGFMKASAATEKIRQRLIVFVLLLAAFLLLTVPHLVLRDRCYCLFETALSLILLRLVFVKPADRQRLKVLLGIFVLLDVAAVTYHMRLNMMEPYKPRMHVIEGRPELGLVGVNEQNPSVLPYRGYFDLFPYNDPDNSYLFSFRVQDMPGIFYRYTNFARNFLSSEDVRPKHKAYASWSSDGGAMQKYLSMDKRLIFSADHAVECAPGIFGSLLKRGLARTVIEVCDDGRLGLPANLDVPPQSVEKRRLLVLPFEVANDSPPFLKDGLAYYQLKLPPKLLPEYFASTFLTEDADSVQLYVADPQGNTRRLQPVQGQIVKPWTFDVNNLRTGYLTAAFLPQDYPTGDRFVLLVPAPVTDGITRVWRWQFDDLGFDYQTPEDRWLVFHYPFDPKWSVTVDGKYEKLYRVNGSFIGLPIQKGSHQVLLRYWPQTPLRGLLLIAMILSTLALMAVIHYSLQDKKEATT